MGASLSAAQVQQCAFVRLLCGDGAADGAAAQPPQWGAAMASLPPLHPACVLDPAAGQGLRSACQEAVRCAAAASSPRLGEGALQLCRQAECAAAQSSPQPQLLCCAVLLLRHLLVAAHQHADGDPAAFAAVFRVPGAEGARVRGGPAAAEALVSLLLHEERLGPADAAGLAAHYSCLCELLAALQVACSAPLYEAALAPCGADGSQDADLIDVVAAHPKRDALCRALLRLCWAPAAQLPLGQRVPHSNSAAGRALAWWPLTAAAAVLPGGIARQLPATPAACAQGLREHAARRAAQLLLALAFRRGSGVLGALRAVAADPGESERIIVAASGAALHAEQFGVLYLLFHEAAALRCAARPPHATELVPSLLRCLHGLTAEGARPAPLYVALTLLLMLSQHDAWCAAVHAEVLPDAPWYTEQGLSNATQGSLLVCELARLMQPSAHGRDAYVTRQAVCVLANLLPSARRLHHHAAQRLVGCLLGLCRRVGRGGPADGMPELLRDVLGGVHAALSGGLRQNLTLVYELLQRREWLQRLEHPALRPHAAAIDAVLVHFDAALDDPDRTSAGRHTTVEQTMTALREAAEDWDETGAAVLPCSERYGYEEEAAPEGFFNPYAWQLALAYYAEAEAGPPPGPPAPALFVTPASRAAPAGAEQAAAARLEAERML
eukprot:TRINITY_DN5740_c6_g1_i1.p2 TRINITY_DN5740_c6_g1~~TRINITY_DN5740_c6_g1_i1.p2  ORF type:complete len:699 (+),score=228.58 TRINITY_DN5740_c6_g1_i1:96-2099(+)